MKDTEVVHYLCFEHGSFISSDFLLIFCCQKLYFTLYMTKYFMILIIKLIRLFFTSFIILYGIHYVKTVNKSTPVYITVFFLEKKGFEEQPIGQFMVISFEMT